MLTAIKNKLRDILPPSAIDTWHKANGVLAALLYGFPSRRMKVIGITGTNGKTTTAHFVSSIFQAAGLHIAMATTIDFQIGTKVWNNNQKQTTMSPFALQKFLRQARAAGCNTAVLEVTSHALVQHRLWSIVFDTVVFTNITHDHLDYHKTFEEYTAAKQRLFKQNPRVSVVNGDDPNVLAFLNFPAHKHFVFSLKQALDIKAKSLYEPILARKVINGTRETMFTAITPNGQVVVNNQLPGRFNISNALAAIGVGIGSDIPLETIKIGIEKVAEVRGRMEKVNLGQDFTVILDYAHTPDAFEKIYEAIGPIARARIITVHGATGARDKTKRPILGALSGRFSDIVIVTNEDPYHEDPMSIIKVVADGVTRGTLQAKPKVLNETLFLIEDRREAIHKALAIAKKGDVVLILGKGAEEVMAVGDTKGNHGFKLIPWNEREIVKEELKKLGYKEKADD
jgi:UDP-N-acetylmuramoyl-L-alanyl-D-glutamate--2,6-diaminopimelate ligase